MTAEADDLLLLADDTADEARPSQAPWPILVVDDDEQVHAMTRLLLRDFVYDDRAFSVVSAYSAAEARMILAERADLPLMLLDVVMETDDAGLRLVRHVREDLGNGRIRIILRTGQPGEAPERDVVLTYDINDYKAKTELTAQKLFTSLVSALRAWQSITTLDRQRAGLERVLEAAPSVNAKRSMRAITEAMADQLLGLIRIDGAPVGVAAFRESQRPGAGLVAVAANGTLAANVGQGLAEICGPMLADRVERCFTSQQSDLAGPDPVLAFATMEFGTTAFLLRRPAPLDKDERALINLLCRQVATTFDNVCLYEDLMASNSSLEQRVKERTAELETSRRALAQANQSLESALGRERDSREQLRHFLSIVSHEFRTPLAIIDSATQFLSHHVVQPGHPAEARVASIRDGVRRLLGLVDSCLADDRLESGQMEPTPIPFDLVEMVRELLDRQAETGGACRFELQAEDAEGQVLGDPEMLALVFGNLLGNAVKYSPDGGLVKITIGRDKQWALISVSDEGLGIPFEDQDRVFQRFFRGGNAHAAPGTGIGLHLVRQIVTLHKGMVSVESEPGQGSTFSVWLPLAEA